MHTKTRIVGILNITPDSFSDGGLLRDNDAIIKAAQKLISEGADVIDIGAESTRPGATALTYTEEWHRLKDILPILCTLAKNNGILTSIDTRHSQTAQKAIKAGVDWVNDVSGADNIDMLDVLAAWDGKIVIMHNLGIPADKNTTIDINLDPISEVKKWLCSRIETLINHGISRNRIIIDPGIGFGKTAAQSWQLINEIEKLHELQTEKLVGHSRKSFLEHVAGKKLPSIAERDSITLTVSEQLVLSKVDYLRVHNVAIHKAYL